MSKTCIKKVWLPNKRKYMSIIIDFGHHEK